MASVIIKKTYLKLLLKITYILLLSLFTVSTLLMPYANFDDTKSLQIVYNNCLANDTDMNLAEFISEKLLSFGFEEDEEEEKKAQLPITSSTNIQMQTGVMYNQPFQYFQANSFETFVKAVPLKNSFFTSADYYPRIFRPPSGIFA